MNLDSIRQSIIEDPGNVWAKEKGWGPVYTAHSDARILIVGQAPGKRAQESGVPWNDLSGDRLREWMRVSRETFYDPRHIALIPMDFYFPGKGVRGDVAPRKGFAEKWHPHILACLPHIELTILIGIHAHAYYLGKRRKKTLTETVRSFREFLPKQIPLVHPSPRNIMWQKRNPWFEREVVPALQKRVREVLDEGESYPEF